MAQLCIRSLISITTILSLVSAIGADPPRSNDNTNSKRSISESSEVQKVLELARPSVVIITVTGRDGERHGIGTGFVISADGLVATNLHVIGEARPMTIQMSDGSEHSVQQVHASDRGLDLAVLRIRGRNLTYLKLGDSDQLAQGQRVVAVGNPAGLKHSVVTGVVSGIREMDNRKMIQLAIPVEPGNSGGPVLDMEGRVHGLITMKSAVTANLGFAVAVNHLKPLLEKPNPVPMSRWLTIGALDEKQWKPLFGSDWRQRAGRIMVTGAGMGIGGRSLCLYRGTIPKPPFEVGVLVKLDDEFGAAGLAFHSDGVNRHYSFYPSAGRLRLSRFDGPNVFTWNVLKEVQSPNYRPGEWNHLKVRLEPGKIRCFVNDQLVIESADRQLTSGKLGLAKFRQTQAQFKEFRVAKTIARHVPDATISGRIHKLLDELPAEDEIVSKDLAPFHRDGRMSLKVIRQRAKQLKQESQRLQRLAADIHTQNIVKLLADSVRGDEKSIDLARATLLVARLDDEEVDVDAYLKELDSMATEIRALAGPDATSEARRDAMNQYLFKENGFHGSRTDYYHRANSYLNRVIDDREGLPITLSILYIELGRRIGLAMEGVGLPGHFIVRDTTNKKEPRLIDVFDGGTEMSRDDAAERVRSITGRKLETEHLATANKKSILLRALRNLFGIARHDDDRESMLRYLDAMLAVDPTLVQDRGLRAGLRHQTGRQRSAIADLDWFLDNKPAGVDLDGVRQMRMRFDE